LSTNEPRTGTRTHYKERKKEKAKRQGERNREGKPHQQVLLLCLIYPMPAQFRLIPNHLQKGFVWLFGDVLQVSFSI
jgi:hypothetical protein